MGKPVNRTDARAKVTGASKVRRRHPNPGYVVCPDRASTGSRGDITQARHLGGREDAGVILVKEEGLTAVLHEDPEAAEKALEAIKADFDVPKPPMIPRQSRLPRAACS